MRTSTDFRPALPARFATRWMLAALILASSVPAWANGTPEETWQEATGTEVWLREFDLSGAKPGTHNVVIRARDSAGNEALVGPYNIRIDPSVGLPTVRIIYPEKGTVLRRDVHIVGVAGGRIGIQAVEIKLDGGEYSPASGSEYWSASVDAASLPDGRHTLTARAVDPRGTSGPETSVSFILDRAPPSVRIRSHESGALIRGAVQFEGTADDANGIARLSLSVDGGKTYQDLGFRGARGETEVGFSFPVQSGKLPDGAAIYYLRAEDGTGAVSVNPVLFFVDNKSPELEILWPEKGATVAGTFRITGTMKDAVGVQSLSCEVGKSVLEIEMRPGDPYWTADIPVPPGTGRSVDLRIVAIDRSGNRTSVSRSFVNDLGSSIPSVKISHPGEAGLATFPADGAIFGYVLGGAGVDAVKVEGGKTYPARPGFRIPSSDIGPGRSELRLQASGPEAAPGEVLKVRVARPALPSGTLPPSAPPPSNITVTSPAPYSYQRGDFSIAGTAEAPAGSRLEYRTAPTESWQEISLGGDGRFSSRVAPAALPEGPMHLELRTVTDGTAAEPVYHPVNRHTTAPEIRIHSPRSGEKVNGSVTVSGDVVTAAPIADLSYTLDGKTFRALQGIPASYGAAFSVIVDFTVLQKSGGSVGVRAVDAAGNSADIGIPVTVDASGDLPSVQLNLPVDGAVATGDFDISGMAFDDDGVAAVHWRIGEGAFSRLDVKQSFRIGVPLSSVRDGERRIEVYAEDVYGRVGPPASAVVRISTGAPTVQVVSPSIEAYNRGTVILRGTARDPNGIFGVRVSMDNGATFQNAEGTESWSLSLNTGAYKDGVYSVLVVAADSFGVESRISSLLNIDNTPPLISLGEPADGRVTEPKLRVSGQTSDNSGVESLAFEISPVSGSGAQRGLRIEAEPRLVILETLDVSSLPGGKYNLRMIASDAAGNTSVLVRGIELVKEAGAHRVVLLDPLPGVAHTGPLTVSGRVTGPSLPASVGIFTGQTRAADAEVDRFGYFRHTLEGIPEEGRLVLWAGFDTSAGEKVRSADHAVILEPYGPVLTILSHGAGDAVTGRPWLSGTAGIRLSPGEAEAAGKKAARYYEVSNVAISLDNGRSFQPAQGTSEWKFRLETAELPRGPLPVLVRAEYADGRAVVRRILLTVDTVPPVVTLVAPQEGSLHAESLLMFGTASDDYGLETLEVNLRAGDKAGYALPQFIQGLYLDTHALGATYGDVGLGVSFFDNNVKLQLQAGMAPPGRFTGTVFGAKLLANVLYLPFDYFLGPDWSFFSMSLALGANFSYFTMDAGSDPLVMSSVLVQWEFARFQFPEWKAFRTFSLYAEPNLWFAASDVEAGAIFKLAFGFRIGIF